MRTRLFSVLLTVALVAPIAALTQAEPIGAVSANPSWTVNSGGWDRSSSPTIADVNRDGRNDIVIGHENGLLHVINGANGADLAGWPRQTGTAIDSTPAVGDLLRNGGREIVVGLGSTFVPNQQGGVKIYNSNGSERCVYRTQDYFNMWTNNPHPDGYADGVYSSPAIGDINGDGFPDVVFGGFDLHIHAIDRNCQPILSEQVEDTVWSSPALYDINGDGRLDILIGGDQSAGGAIDWSGGEFRAISWSPTSTVSCWHCRELWKRQLNDTMWSSPAVGDIDGDGRPEVVVGGGHFYNRSDGHKVFAWHVDDGSALPGWPVATSGSTMPSPSLGDLNGNGIPEVVVSSADGYVRAYHSNGTVKWAARLWHFSSAQLGGPVASPIIADLNGDGQNDVAAGNDFGYFVMDGATGAIMTVLDGYESHDSAGAVADFGPGVGWRLIVAGFNTPNHTSRLQAFSMPTPRRPPPWPMFRRDSLHHAGPVALHLLAPGLCRASQNPAAHPSSASSKGYWVAGADGAIYALKGAPYRGSAIGRVRGLAVAMAATRSGNGYYMLDNGGSIFPFGDAHSFGSMAGFHLNAPVIALAPTPSGRGYWLMASDGGVFSFGDARFFGSMGGRHLNKPIISIAGTRTGHGYWLLASDGGVFSFGDAKFHGSTGNLRLSSPVLSMATAPSGQGYWLVAGDGGIFSFGVPFYGSVPGIGLCQTVPGVQIRPTLTGRGYFVLALNGKVFAFGDALAGASAPPLGGWRFAADFAVRP
ncbi:MAG TPA: VCBS repeat-containing protein [Acidimicrobiia bacterium]|nr:VCBS repeat-containing protein [Acidimicrobiia bacterium]